MSRGKNGNKRPKVVKEDSVEKVPVPTRKISLSSGKVYVFDDCFNQELIDDLGRVFLELDYEYRPSFDNELSYGLSTQHLECMSDLVPRLNEFIDQYNAELVNRPKEQFLSHGYCAAIRFGDSTIMHQDIDCEDCLTFIYYGNLYWNPRWGGETLFYDDTFDAMVSVSPKPGRLVLFNGSIWHRSGIPLKSCPSFRYVMSVFYRCAKKQLKPMLEK